MEVYVINHGFFKLDGGAMFGVVPKSIWQRSNPADENNMCSWALRSILIVDENRKILIDTGMGDKQDAKFFSHYYMHGEDNTDKSLAQHGFTRDDITDVFLTHLHFDHCGGAIVKENNQFIPAYKNAIYWSNEQHWQWAIEPNAREKASFLTENILPIQESGKLRFIPSSQATISPQQLERIQFTKNIEVLFANGHTDAMMLPKFQYKNRTIVYMADLLPSAGHIPLPYVMAYDMFPLKTLKEKTVFFEEAVANNYILFLEHDPINECCTLQKTEKGFRISELFSLSEL